MEEVALASRDRPVVRRPDRAGGRGGRSRSTVANSGRSGPPSSSGPSGSGCPTAGWRVLTSSTEAEVRGRRTSLGVRPVFKTVDTCAGEFPARTPYHYSTYEEQDEVRPAERPRVVILGAGPNRIGQGIEFDYACVHAAFALGEAGFESVMVNSNPETVSTDYDTSARLYFEPLSTEDVLAVCEAERPIGVICQFGGQTPLRMAQGPRGGRVPRPRDAGVLDRPGRGSREVRRAPARARHPGARARRGERPRARPGRSRRGSGTPSWCDRPTCSAGVRWRSCTARTSSNGSSRAPRRPAPTTRC